MVFSITHVDRPSVQFSVNEFTGAVGDSATVFPVVVAIAALTDLSLAHLLLGFAVFQIIWGLYYGLPISVEPMKALTALVIAGALTPGELAVAGLLAGGVLLVAGVTGMLGHIERYVSQPVIRGVQIAVALLLLETGVQLSLDNLSLAFVAMGVAAVVIIGGYQRASALVVLCVGVVLTIVQTGLPAPQVPTFTVTLPTLAAASAAFDETVAQLAMTIGNAAVATSLLLSDYYDADISSDDLATSMGVMNLFAIPFGTLPMCHGSGGVAGKYAFGARTAGANLILGGIYAVTAVLAVGVVATFPLSMLGVVLVLIALELGRAGFDTEHLSLTLGIGILGVVTNVGIAFVIGVLGSLAIERP